MYVSGGRAVPPHTWSSDCNLRRQHFLEIRTKDGNTLVLDCGTGIRELGLDMLRRRGPHRIHLLIGHTHWEDPCGHAYAILAGRVRVLESAPDSPVDVPGGARRG